jgi:hypothetical protein
MLLSAFLLHFLKLYLIMDYRNSFPSSITYASFENICAVNAIIFPFLYLSNHKLSKDYMIIIGVISGLIAFVIPPDGLGRHFLDPIVIRFYFSHYMIFAVPFLMYKFKMHQVDYKHLFRVMFYLYGVLTLILINEFLLNMLGIVNATFADYKPIAHHELYSGRYSRIERVGEYPKWVITDVRFENECLAIQKMGGILINIKRPFNHRFPEFSDYGDCYNFKHDKLRNDYPEFYSKITHSSETGLQNWVNYDYVIENDCTINELLVKVNGILVSEHLK